MVKYLFLLLFSVNAFSAHSLKRVFSDLAGGAELGQAWKFAAVSEENKGDLEIPGVDAAADAENVSEECDLEYLDMPKLDIETYLVAVDTLQGKSFSKSFGMYLPEIREDAYKALEKFGLGNFVQLFRTLVDAIIIKAQEQNKVVMHIAVRVDPDGEDMSADRDRNLTSKWHAHGEDGVDDRYLFALTRNPCLSTQIKIEGKESYIKTNKLFLLPGAMLHRTPAPAPGKRIQLSISVM